jgi:hypothetical protein
MLNRSHNSSRSTSFRPTVEALENRLVPSGSAVTLHQEVMPPPALVGLTLENSLGRQVVVVGQDPETTIEPLVRLRRVVYDAVTTPGPNTPLLYGPIEVGFLKTIEGDTATVVQMAAKVQKTTAPGNPTEELSLNF